MSELDDSGYDDSDSRPPDAKEGEARERLGRFFDENRERVFYVTQLEVMNERDFFHWVTGRVLHTLVADGLLKTENRTLDTGAPIKLLWHRRHRYFKRDAAQLMKLVNEYSSPNISGSIGLHAEQMVLAGFASKEFIMRARGAREFRGQVSSLGKVNLDFIFERDNIAYGIEVKNTLSYGDHDELFAKVAVAEEIGTIPVLVTRMMPRSWANELIQRGGFALILGYQLYPWTHVDLARRVNRELGLPVDAPKALQDGTMERFMRWHRKRVK